MISSSKFSSAIAASGVSFVVGVPDSLLSSFCNYLHANDGELKHVVAANEGTAIAIAAGHHFATSEVPLVYMQNSGLGNAVNPLLSLVDSSLFAVPMVLLIGWRGEPGTIDEPQHLKQGRITEQLLSVMEIPIRKLDSDASTTIDAVKWAVTYAQNNKRPVALLANKKTFEPAELVPIQEKQQGSLSREKAIKTIVEELDTNTIFVSTTGMISRELYEARRAMESNPAKDLLVVGSMGHASQISLGIALASRTDDRPIVCLDGDGSALMHLGGMTTIGNENRKADKPLNLVHVLLNNGAHDSVGGLPTAAQAVSLSNVARACCYDRVADPVSNTRDLQNTLSQISSFAGLSFLEILVTRGARTDVGRPHLSPMENKLVFMECTSVADTFDN